MTIALLGVCYDASSSWQHGPAKAPPRIRTALHSEHSNSWTELGVDIARRLETLKVAEPAKRQAGDKVGSVDELVGKLKALGVVA